MASCTRVNLYKIKRDSFYLSYNGYFFSDICKFVVVVISNKTLFRRTQGIQFNSGLFFCWRENFMQSGEWIIVLLLLVFFILVEIIIINTQGQQKQPRTEKQNNNSCRTIQ